MNPHIFQRHTQAGRKGNAHAAFNGNGHAECAGSRRFDAGLVVVDIDEEHHDQNSEQQGTGQSANGEQQNSPYFRDAIHGHK